MLAAMTLRFSFVTMCALLCADAVFVEAQDVKPIAVPEKIMASRLQTYGIPPLSKSPLASRCSNALAVVDVVVGTDGKVRSADYASGFSELKDPALEAVQRWSYVPYLVDGKPVAAKTQASIFYLGDGEATPMYVPDGNGGAKGGSILPLPVGCGPGPQLVKQGAPLGADAPAQTDVKEATATSPDANGAYECHAGTDAVCPKVTYAVDPQYGLEARRIKLEGTVLISLVVGIDGHPHDVAVARSIRDGLDAKFQEAGAELDQHAMDAARKFRFQPGSLKGVVVPMVIKVEMNFQLY